MILHAWVAIQNSLRVVAGAGITVIPIPKATRICVNQALTFGFRTNGLYQTKTTYTVRNSLV